VESPSITELAGTWEARLRELVEQLDVPGAVLGVSHRGERVLIPAGIAGLRNPRPVGIDTVFQLGSISKVYTATLLLVLAGPEILERSVAELVPEARWMERTIRVEHLLTHSSGLGGDHFADTGRGEDALARYVTGLEELPRDVPLAPGRRYSYCNSGFAVLGRLVEILSGQPYDAALWTHLLQPLNARATSTLPEDTILHPVALGHNRRDPDPLRADDTWSFARACNPLGGVCATVGDVLAFAEMHLRDGRAADGTAVLASGVAESMRRRQLEAPVLGRPSARGLGWGIYDWTGSEVIGHDGETLGQVASLRLLPAEDLALVVLANAIPDGDEITRTLTEAVLGAWGVGAPTVAGSSSHPPNARGFDPAAYLGRYRNLMGTAEVSAADHGLTVTTRYSTEGLEEETEVTRLIPIGDGAFVDADRARPTRAVRFDDCGPDGRCHSYFTGRIAWRVNDVG
jgi:CubicO group peptidase (beta-lactamase class C family)